VLHQPGNSNRLPERAGDLWEIMTGKPRRPTHCALAG
jgi:hypothetical protein